MNTETKDFFMENIESANTGEEEIVLASPDELTDEAQEIAQSTKSDEKYPFALYCDSNQKDFLLSMLHTVGAIVETNDEDVYILNTRMNMTQLELIKRLDCVERVQTDEGNLFIDGESEKPVSVKQNLKELTLTENETTEPNVNEKMTASSNSIAEASYCCPANTNMESAQEIEVEKPESGNICCPGAEQWFKFTTPQSDTYTIYTTGSLDTVGTLYDCCGNFITQVDDYTPAGKLNFRIIRNLNAKTTYYVRVTEAKSNTGRYTLKVTQKTLVNSISVNPSEITLEHIGKVYELPISPGTFTNVEGAEPLNNLSASTVPSSADEKKVLWSSFDNDIIRIQTGWNNNQRYQTLTVVGSGTAKLYAYDWDENGKRGECTVIAGYGWPVYLKPTINTRDSWGARGVVSDRLVARTRAPEMIVFHHTADKFSETETSKIIEEIKETQDEHIDGKKKCDIAYHFIIDPAGGIWQGAMIDDYQRGHADGHFDDIGVVILGDFEKRWQNGWSPNTLNENQKSAMKALSKWLCYEYNLTINKTAGISPITTHRAVDSETECPGDNAASWIENDLRVYINDFHP